jgi:protein-S-isoprenylcysteine O-methyltransferase Ste14
MMIKGIIFVVLTVIIVMKFRKELFAFHRHGPYMFVAAEGLLLLFIFNAGSMFQNPFSPRQVFSWILMLVSAGFALSGFYALKKHGQAVEDWEDTTRVVHEGVFQYIRHPLYASLMLLAGGMLLKDVSLQAASAFLVTLCFLLAASLVEERENVAKFGVEYQRYALITKRYLPFIV